MALLLHLETATTVCSVALSKDDQLIGLRVSKEDRSHASVLAVFCDELLKEHHLTVSSLDAVVVSKGPGSYTGLRIGVATAKGLCYSDRIPLIAVDTLQAMALHYVAVNHPGDDALIVPMLDARRNEVYTAVFDISGNIMMPVQAMILTAESLKEMKGKRVICVGDGAAKASSILNHHEFKFDDTFRHTAEGMIKPALDKFNKKQFEDLAYFEPYYLKEFAGAIPKRVQS